MARGMHDYCEPAHCVREQYDLPRLASMVKDLDGTCKRACELLDNSLNFRAEVSRAERDGLWSPVLFRTWLLDCARGQA